MDAAYPCAAPGVGESFGRTSFSSLERLKDRERVIVLGGGPAGLASALELAERGVEVTLLLVVEDVARARAFYTEVLGAELFRQYGGDSAVLQFQGTPSSRASRAMPSEKVVAKPSSIKRL